MISKKTWLVPLLTVVMLMSLCACGKSDNAKVCESLINKIGEVTLDSEKTIRVAEEAYDALTEEEKVQIKKSAEKLSESRDAYNQLLIDTKLGSVEELIDAIGEVTLDSEKAIINAEEAFNALSDEEKEIIKESGEKLEASRASYDTMLMEQHASSVISSIDAIGDVTLDAKSAIEGARTLYNALTSDEKAMVTNYNVLEMAEAELDTLVKEEKQKLLNEYLPKFNVSEDKVEGITWYMPKNTPQYINERCYVTAMVGVEGDKVWMCNRFNYTGDNWVFYNSDDILESGTAYLVKSLHISERDLIDGLAYTVADLTGSTEYAEVAENGYDLYSEYSYAIFQLLKSSLFTVCVRVTTNAYILNGEAEKAENALSDATGLMKELNEKYPDYEYYTKLKELLTQVSALLDFCNNPIGSFEQVKVTINDYKNNIRDLTNDLNYIYAE